ncbi:MAG: helix-turn-helix domain-containing protein [Peptoniphilus sp.]|uniref:helix-turn-helix domain-containing protein n=1 Tax=Peptoniphilus sp. TaxID=1971214 RepID=UPI0025DC1495|nr:helix-turn-helix transcriptional regulator [Peptoniphilus sp.]MCI5642612.1 helix-turn-helix domain-containing protein [Peptoniphilus sp.]MDD7352673.1 helix-turn-helix transcriptional regulator [Peptoniphilaceae bacterium]
MYGQKIKDKRRELNLSQEDLANKIFVTRQAISKWENDKASPTMENLKELSKIYGVDMSYFICEGEKESKNKLGNNEIIKKEVFSFFFYIVLCFLGIIFFAAYYLLMEEFLKLDPKDFPQIILTIYMIIGTIAFSQAYKFVAKKIENIDYMLFSKVVLPVVYIFAPIIVLYFIIKNK